MAFVDPLITHAAEQQTVFRASVGRRSSHHVQERFRELLVRLVSDELGVGVRASWHRVATVHFLAGSLLELLSWWLGARRPIKTSEITAHYHALSASAVMASQKAGASVS